jgi:CRP-like cAMP-binding protein
MKPNGDQISHPSLFIHLLVSHLEVGDSMYFINSGTVQVFSKDGFQKTLGKNDFFGEGALLNPKKIRSASIRCVTPVHAIEVSR